MSGRPWDDEELELLEEWTGKLSLDTIAKRLGRSKNAVFLKRQRIGLGGYLQNTDLLSRYAVAGIMGVTCRTLIYWERLGLKCQRKGSYRMYSHDELLRFLESHQDLWNAKRVTDDTIFADCKWFEDKKNKDVKQRYFWSASDAANVRYLRSQGWTIPMIAEKTGHTESSVRYLLYTKKRRNKKNERVG